MNKKWILSIVLCAVSIVSQAQEVIKDVFSEMPDSLMLLLTKNNRLDCIDFIENNVEAKVRNKMGGYSELLVLQHSYLKMRLTANSDMELKIIPSDTTYLVLVGHTFKAPLPETELRIYDEDWNEVPLKEVLKCPDYTDYWTQPTDVSDADYAYYQQSLDLKLVKISFDAESDTLTFQLQTGDLEQSLRTKVERCMHSLQMKWDGKRFISVPLAS